MHQNGIIPEAIVQVTSVSSMKTAFFNNPFGEFSYKNLKSELMFGYDLKQMDKRRNFLFATPEKAILELLKVTDLNVKKRDFEHLLFNKKNSEKILRFSEFMQALK